MRTLTSLVKSTIRNGGGTFDRDTLSDIRNGCAVAVIDGTFRIVPVFDRLALRAAIAACRAAFPNDHIGTWKDGDVIHVDPVTVTSRRNARRIARIRKQLAFFDIDRLEEVRVS